MENKGNIAYRVYSLRHGINRVLKEEKYHYNIIISDIFKENQDVFEDA